MPGWQSSNKGNATLYGSQRLSPDAIFTASTCRSQTAGMRSKAARRVINYSETATDPKEPVKVNNIGAGIAIGAGIGAALGVAMGNIAVGVAIGIAIGAAIGAAKQKKDR